MITIDFVPVLFGDKASVYSIRQSNDNNSEFQKFVIQFENTSDKFLKIDIGHILEAIDQVADYGVQQRYFRNEGKVKDRVVAIPLDVVRRNYDLHGSLRLYCIRISDELLIIGGGGIKHTQSYEEDPVLSQHVTLLQKIDKELFKLEQGGVNLFEKIINLSINIE